MNVNLILCSRDFRDALYITAHRVANFIPGIGYYLISFEMLEIINHASFTLFLVKLSYTLRKIDMNTNRLCEFRVAEFYFILISAV